MHIKWLVYRDKGSILKRGSVPSKQIAKYPRLFVCFWSQECVFATMTFLQREGSILKRGSVSSKQISKYLRFLCVFLITWMCGQLYSTFSGTSKSVLLKISPSSLTPLTFISSSLVLPTLVGWKYRCNNNCIAIWFLLLADWFVSLNNFIHVKREEKRLPTVT